MPDRSTTQQTEQQFWTPDQREQILNYVNKRAHDAIDEKGLDAEIEGTRPSPRRCPGVYGRSWFRDLPFGA